MTRRVRMHLAGVVLLLFLSLPMVSAEPVSLQIEAPVWAPGTSWDIRIVDPGRPEPVVARLAIAQDGLERFYVGATSPDPRILFARTVPSGIVEPQTFAFDIDGRPFEALRFPLAVKKTWSTAMGDDAVTATVTHVHQGVATIEYQVHRPDGHVFDFPETVRATYDASLGFFSRFEQPNGQLVEVTRSGDSECGIWRFEGTRSFDEQQAGYRRSGMASIAVPEEMTGLAIRISILRVASGASPYGVADAATHAIRVMGPLADGATGDARAPQAYELVQRGDPYNETAFYTTDKEDGRGPGGTWNVARTRTSIWGQATLVSELIGYENERYVPTNPDGSCGTPVASLLEAPRALPPPNASAWVFLALMAAPIWWALRPGGIAWTLLARIRHDQALEHATRRRIIEAVQKDPGITTQELSRALEVPWATAVHHLMILERLEILVSSRTTHQVHWFDVAQGALGKDRTAIAAVRSKATAAVFDYIQANPGLSLSAIARALAVRHTTVRFHLRKLLRAELLESRPHGRRYRYFAADRSFLRHVG